MTVVLADGCFDPLHAGHIDYLEAAAALGDELIVRVASDEHIYWKGREPLLSFSDRYTTLGALRMVDAVTTSDTLEAAVREHKPDILAKGEDWRDRLPVAVVEACREVGTAVMYVRTKQYSSTDKLRDWTRRTNEAALQRFEQRAFSVKQQSYHFTGYSLDERRKAEGEHPRIIAETFGRDATYLDYGCGPGHLVSMLAEQGAYKVWGYEPGARILPNLPFEVVICREVLEHVAIKDVGGLVANLISCSSRYVYLTTRFTKAPLSMLDVTDEFKVDPTHITCLDQNLLRALFVMHGMRRRVDLEARLDWQKKGRVLVYEHAV